MYRFIIVLLNVTALCAQISPELDAQLEKRSHTYQETTLPYRLYVPTDYSTDQGYPLMLFLHGARWSGTDNTKQLDNELAQLWVDSTRQATNPCFVVYPQIPSGTVWESARGEVASFPENPVLETVYDALETLFDEFSIDQNRVNICGKSIGALGVYGMVARYPDLFAAALPAAGFYVYSDISQLAAKSWWIFHNRDDSTVPIEQSRFIVNECEKTGHPFVFTHCKSDGGDCVALQPDTISVLIEQGFSHFYSEFDDSGHQLEPNVVATFGVYEWTMAQTKQNVKVEQTNIPDGIELFQNYPNPFNPTTTIRYELPITQEVSLILFNSLGQPVKTMVKSYQTAGLHDVTIDASDLSSGIYYYQIRTRTVTKNGKMVVVK